jgi:hypothetical protein
MSDDKLFHNRFHRLIAHDEWCKRGSHVQSAVFLCWAWVPTHPQRVSGTDEMDKMDKGYLPVKDLIDKIQNGKESVLGTRLCQTN